MSQASAQQRGASGSGYVLVLSSTDCQRAIGVALDAGLGWAELRLTAPLQAAPSFVPDNFESWDETLRTRRRTGKASVLLCLACSDGVVSSCLASGRCEAGLSWSRSRCRACEPAGRPTDLQVRRNDMGSPALAGRLGAVSCAMRGKSIDASDLHRAQQVRGMFPVAGAGHCPADTHPATLARENPKFSMLLGRVTGRRFLEAGGGAGVQKIKPPGWTFISTSLVWFQGFLTFFDYGDRLNSACL